MKNLKDKGLVVKHNSVGEADKIITVITSNHGKLRMKAPGIRRLYSRKAGNLELFNHVEFSAVSGKHLDIITEVKLIESFPALKNDLMKVGVGYHFCELVDGLISERIEHKDIYDLLRNSLNNVQQSSGSTEELSKYVKIFEIHLLESLGFGLPEPITQGNLVQHIENILEKPLKSRKFINLFHRKPQIASNLTSD